MRKPLIAGNWKMNKTNTQAVNLIEELKKGYDKNSVDVAVCPPYTALRDVKQALNNSTIRLGAQNVYYEDAGAYTGEISAPMLKDLEVELVIVGHSERRKIFGETDSVVNKKLKHVLSNGMTPILCVGETLEEREKGETQEVVRHQIIEDFNGLTGQEIGRTVIAYEPIWAIGTGKSATAEEAGRVIGYIRGILEEIAGAGQADVVRILYGGSVNAGNAASILGQPHIDGALVGGASLKTDEFLSIIKHAAGEERN